MFILVANKVYKNFAVISGHLLSYNVPILIWSWTVSVSYTH